MPGDVPFLPHPPARSPSLPPSLSLPPPAHLLLKSFSRYLLKWAKLAIQSAARGAGVSGSCSSSPRAPRGGASSSTRHTRASAHAQRRAGAWGGGGEADGAAGCHVTARRGPGAEWTQRSVYLRDARRCARPDGTSRCPGRKMRPWPCAVTHPRTKPGV